LTSPSEEVRLLREIAKWTRESALPTVKSRVERLLDTDAKRRAYAAMADGKLSLMAIEKLTGANHNDQRAWLTTWEAEGIAEPGASPPKAAFTLHELGIAAPPPRSPRPRKSAGP
jgi:hypothetical protein